eukprot:1159306-Pelagomonas_calceolata.AAC.15
MHNTEQCMVICMKPLQQLYELYRFECQTLHSWSVIALSAIAHANKHHKGGQLIRRWSIEHRPGSVVGQGSPASMQHVQAENHGCPGIFLGVVDREFPQEGSADNYMGDLKKHVTAAAKNKNMHVREGRLCTLNFARDASLSFKLEFGQELPSSHGCLNDAHTCHAARCVSKQCLAHMDA